MCKGPEAREPVVSGHQMLHFDWNMGVKWDMAARIRRSGTTKAQACHAGDTRWGVGEGWFHLKRRLLRAQEGGAQSDAH